MSSASTSTPSSSSSKQPQYQRRVILLNAEETTAATAPTSSTINRKGAGPKRSMRRISISSSGSGGGASSSSERLDTPKTPVEAALASVSSAQTQNYQYHDMRTIETFLQMCGTEKFSGASASSSSNGSSSSHGIASSTMSIEKIMETLDTLYHQYQYQYQQTESMNIFHGVQLLRWSVDTDPHLALIYHVKRIYQSEYPYKCDRIRYIYMLLKACELIVDHRSKEQIASMMNAQYHGNNNSIVMAMHVLEEYYLAYHRCDYYICCARSLDSCLSKQRIVNLGIDPQTGKERYSIYHVPYLYRDAEMKIIRDLGVDELLDSVYVALCGMVHVCEDGVCRYAAEDPVTKQITCSITRRAFTTWSTFSNNPTFDYGVVRKDSDGVIRGTSNVGGENGYDFDDTTNDVLMGDGSGASSSSATTIALLDSSAEDMNDLSDVYSSNGGSSSGGNEDARNATVQLMSGTIAKQKKVEPVDLNHCNVPHLRRYVEYHMTFMYNWIKTVWRTKRERLAVVVGSGSSSLGGPSAGSNALFGLSLIQGGGVTANSTSGISLGGSIGRGYASAPTEGGGGGHGALTSEESAIVARNRRKERQYRQYKQQQKYYRQTFQRAQYQYQMKSLKRAREVDKEEWTDDNDDESSDIDDSLLTSAAAVTEEQSASERAFYHYQSILGGGSSFLASSYLASTSGSSYSSSGNRYIFFKQDGTPCDPLGEELSSSYAASVSSARVMLHSVSTAAGPQKYVRIFQKKVTKFYRILAYLEKIHRPLVLPVQSAAASSSRVYKLNFAEIKRTVYGALEYTRMLVDRHPSHANDSDEDEENGQDLLYSSSSSSSPTSSSSYQSALDLGSRSAQYTHNIVDVLDPYRIAPNTMSVSSANAAAAAQSDATAAQKTKTRTRGIAEFTYYLSFLLEEPFRTLVDWESNAQQLHESLLTTSSQKSTAMHAWHMPKDPRVVDRYVVKRYGVRVPESYYRNYNKMHAGSGSYTMYHSSSAASGSKKRKTNAGGGTVVTAAAVDDRRDSYSHVVYAVLEEDARRYRQFFVEAFKIVRTLCPGFYRLVTELDHIIELCKEKRRSLHYRLRELKQDGAMPNVPHLLEYARFLPMNYHVVLHAHMSDEEVAACVDLMYHFWRLCEQSPYVCQPTEQEQKEYQLLYDKQKVRHLNVKNHCIAMLYAMEQGLKIHCHTVIPPHPKFSQRGYLVNLNNINDYGYDSEYRRTNYNSGSYTLTQCIKSLLETRPAHELVYHHCI